jgi:hypothetical protein
MVAKYDSPTGLLLLIPAGNLNAKLTIADGRNSGKPKTGESTRLSQCGGTGEDVNMGFGSGTILPDGALRKNDKDG